MSEGREGPGAPAPQSADQGPATPPGRLAWGGAWLACLALAEWMARVSVLWLLVAALGTLLWSASALRRRERWWTLTAVALWLVLGTAIGVQYRLWQVARSWPQVQARVEERAAGALNAALDGLVERGESAVEEAGRLGGVRVAPRGITRLEAARRRTGVSALALYDAAGAPLAWAGEHRGAVPLSVRRGERPYIYSEGPLFSYLYFVRPLQGGRVAVAAVLLEADLAAGEGMPPFAEQFAARHGLTPRFTLPDRARCPGVWDWKTDRPILSVCFLALTHKDWWDRTQTRGQRGVWAEWVLAVVVLGFGWYRRRQGAPGVPVAVATLGLLLSPLGRIFGTEQLFSPLQFILPFVPGDVTLGMLLVLLSGAAVWILTRVTRGTRRLHLPLWLQAAGAALAPPAALALVRRSAAGGLLANHPGGGFALQLTTTLLLALPFYLLLQSGRPREPEPRRSALLGLGLALAAALGIALVLGWRPDHELPLWTASLWALPFALVAWGGSAAQTPRRSFRLWLAAGWLAGTVALAQLWPMHTQARLENAERELARLGTETDPFLDFLLRQFADRARAFAAEGEEGVNLLYHSWVASGMARQGYEARVTSWAGGVPDEELQLSDLQTLPPLVREMVDSAAARTEPLVRHYTQNEAVHYLLLVPLPGDRTLSVAVPPRRQLGRATALARFLRPQAGPGADAQVESLLLVPAPHEGARAAPAPGVRQSDLPVEWVPTGVGWRSEAMAHFPSGWMHAHLFVRTSSLALLLVRAVLLLTALLALLALFWGGGRLLCGELALLPAGRRRWFRSFRGRLTATLFLFFLVPTAVFAVVAYSAVAREVVQSAASLARRALEQAAPRVAGGSLARLGGEVDADLLLYHQVTLVNASSSEVLDLGLFPTWLPANVFLDFASGEDLEAQEESRLARSPYLVAYRRLNPATVLAVPIPLASDQITRRQHEFRDIALLLCLLGLGFSVVLSLLVGRALSRPIDELRRAAATVGSGNLRMRLHEERQDEFGSVYHAFNQMVMRLRGARRALVRETRRTETIVAEAATGVLALNGEGRVELVNPRAAEILGSPRLGIGEPLPHDGPMLRAVLSTIDTFHTSRAAELGTELEVDGRIVRVRLRRLPGAAGERGTVVAALEDVTAEVRAARVLAWGEMARQVAHEIKNPLTPIKLSVQHLRRAFLDRRPEFGEILERNVEAILREIDRLGEISRAFARFGAPAETADRLQPVDVPRAVEETLALYRSGEDGVRYRVEIGGERIPRAIARVGELKEVLVNLLENARDALDGGGEIAVSILPTADRAWVEVVVADTGEGIPAELLPRIFEPHFSTRTSGTGLGLAIVRRLVESWGGEVGAQSAPGEGARVTLRLPASREDARSG